MGLTLRAALWLAVGIATIRADVIINEVHYAPGDKTVPEEFIELYNSGSTTVDLGGWHITGAVSYEFPPVITLAAGEYLVVAQDPTTLTNLYGAVPAVGPFFGRLSNQGETIVLRNRSGQRMDVVDYQRGFPWPTLGGDDGYSMELLHPDLDNQLGGSWRISNPGGAIDPGTLISAGATWRYRKGTEEASSPPDMWRSISFNDASWSSGRLPIGYGENFVVTRLDDMRNGYSSVYLRKRFVVDDLAEASSLTLDVQFDDGFNAWINGTHVASGNVSGQNLPFNGTADSALENLSFVEHRLPSPLGYLVEGTNYLTIQVFNASLGGSSDAFLDARLTSSSRAGAGPTPGAVNSMYTKNAPPQIRQLQLSNSQPIGGEAISVSVKVTDPDGVDSVELEYQVVEPGSYVRLTDASYESNWTSIAMNALLDDRYNAVIPGSANQHRNLIRYRITATDTTGLTVRVPYFDDPSPNFAYFVYDGIPEWRGASRPGSTVRNLFSEAVMRSLPAYHLIAQATDVTNCQYNGSFDGRHFFGTLVYDGVVYDHMEFENRGEFSTYVSGKNKWRFHFNRGHEFAARDNFGELYRAKWQKMNLSAVASPWVPTNRGMAGLDEAGSFRFYELAGVPSPKTNYFQFRVIDDVVEAHPSDQYVGDLWGLYHTIEHTDGRFLDERGLPDGNVYKIEGGNGDKRHQGNTQSTSSADYNAYRSGFNSSQPISWWRANTDLPIYYSFRAVNRAVNNMDLRDGWNHCQYHNPETGRWEVIPWDLDMMYMPLTHWSGVINVQNCLSQHSVLNIEYKNRARELQDLLFTRDQVSQVIDELMSFVSRPGQVLTWADIDEAMWNRHPRTSSSHRDAFYRNPSTHSARGGTITRTLVTADHFGMGQWAKDFMITGYGAGRLNSHAADSAIPRTPTVDYVGLPDYPVNTLTFQCSDFSDPQGTNTFAAMKWRVGEILGPGATGYDPTRRKPWEIETVWETPELSSFADHITVPADALKIGAWHRLRVRMKDSSGRWSHWSDPVEFRTSPPSVPFPPQTYLRITEIMYNPANVDGGPFSHEGEGEDYQFVELQNVGPAPLDLTTVSFVDGIEFDFAESAVTVLQPQEFIVVVKNRLAFTSRYGEDMNIAGEFRRNLSNSGENLTLVVGANATIHDFAYDDTWYPETDGGGHSLVIADAEAELGLWALSFGWRASATVGGSPGYPDGPPPTGGFQLGGDSNQDSRVDIADAISLMRSLFGGAAGPPPCEGLLDEGGNLLVLDVNGDGGVDLSDVLSILNYLFVRGPAPSLGTRCVRVEGCPSACQ